MINACVIAVSAMLLATGAFFTVKTRFVQLLGFFRRSRRLSRVKRQGSAVTPYMALATALGGSIGTANIAGVASALAIGGAGSIFWMWMSGLLGMATKYAEIKLAMRYRQSRSDGAPVGGAMYYMEKGLHSRRMGVVFAALCVSGALLGGGMVQSNTIAESAAGMISALGVPADHFTVAAVAGVITAILCGGVILGGVESIARVATMIVPLASLLYVGASIAVIAVNAEELPRAFSSIVTQAFGIRPAVGGAAGYAFMLALRTGIARGTFSNEAGIGSAPMAHASSSESDPHAQAMLGVVEVFVDTIVICTLTALVVLCSGIAIPYGAADASGMLIAGDAFATLLGGNASGIFLCVSVALFAITSIIGWSLYGERGVEYVFGERGVKPYRLILVACIAIGAVVPVSIVWDMGEISNLLMAAVNIVALLALSAQVGDGREPRRLR
ncbi:MAG: amino acid carrier protein [Clostridia bacterium]|nr:amino acid carrier protein [Clostridia bacterium]